MNESPTSDEKVLAALAHASVLFFFFGPIGPTIVWILQRNKSKYVRFHALQAMGYQVLSMWGMLIGIFIVIFGGTFLLAGLGAIFANSTSNLELVPFIAQPIILLGMFGIWGIFLVGGIAGAVSCMIDRDFRYPFIGRWLKQKAFNVHATDSENEEWEDSWVSGMCHFTVILQFWGILTSLVVWFSQKERSLKLRFQALQAAIYQLIAFGIYLAGMFLYTMLFVLMFFIAIAFSTTFPSSGGELPPLVGGIFLIFFLVITVFWLLMMIGGPVYLLLGAIAGFLTARGRNFKYPIIGSMIMRRVSAPKMTSEVVQP